MSAVAIASENDDFDGEVYRRLLMMVLGREVEAWRHGLRFSGWGGVLRIAPLFLERAAAAGLRHALLARDNDGTRQKGPAHEDSHIVDAQAANPDGCRTCQIVRAIPHSWGSAGGVSCVAVPIQLLETWILVADGRELTPSPEYCFACSRRETKAALYGRGAQRLHSAEAKLKKVLAILEGPQALERLRRLGSFRHFEAQIARWSGGALAIA